MKCLLISIIADRFLLENEKGERLYAKVASKLRGRRELVVGDYVECEKIAEHYLITSLYERKNILIRPKVANVDLALVLMSCREPDFSYELVNRLIMQVDYFGIEALILATKADLIDQNAKDKIHDYYAKMGYKVFFSGYNEELSNELIKYLNKKIVVLCGQSGVGKSSFINRLRPDLDLKTDQISFVLNRGKHTTRTNCLYRYRDAYIDDSPGFSSIDLEGIDLDLFKKNIKAFHAYQNQCRFLDCSHEAEPCCAIREAVDKGEIPRTFYDTYLRIVEFIKTNNYRGDRHRRLK